MPGLSVRRILGQQALCRALVGAGLSPRDVDAIFVASVTGVASPSLDARLVNRMGMSRRIKRIPIFGLGCWQELPESPARRITCVPFPITLPRCFRWNSVR